MCCDVPHHVLSRLEADRGGTAPIFWMDLAGSWAVYGDIQPIYQRPWRFEVPTDMWLAFLAGSGFEDFDVVELRRVLKHGGSLQRAIDYLNTARRLVSSDPPRAVGICRLLVEAVDRDLSDQGFGTIKDHLTVCTDERRGQHYGRIVTAVKQLAGMNHHDFGRTSVFTRPEALALGASRGVGPRASLASTRRAVITALTEQAADPLRPRRIAEADAVDRLGPDNLSAAVARLHNAVARSFPEKGSVNGPPKCQPFDPICPLFERDGSDHGLPARTADRAVLVGLRRFLAGIHAIWGTPDKREVGSSNLPGPTFQPPDPTASLVPTPDPTSRTAKSTVVQPSARSRATRSGGRPVPPPEAALDTLAGRGGNRSAKPWGVLWPTGRLVS